MTAADPASLHGIHAILYALFNEDEALNRKAMKRQVDICLEAGVHGMAVLGLATEVAKLSEAERHTIVEWAAEDTAGKVPLAVTISGPSVAEQVRQVRHAENSGAGWLILQPPAAGHYSAAEFISFHCAVAESTKLPVAIQNAPAFLGRGLDAQDVTALRQRCPNFQLIKAEGTAVETAGLIEATHGTLPVFNGRAGLELIDNLDLGCRGLILAPDCIDHAVRAYDHHRNGEPDSASAIYRKMLPAIVFEMQGIETLICYGKRLFGARAGLRIFDRSPALRPHTPGTAAGRKICR